jgi:hypothetical protein
MVRIWPPLADKIGNDPVLLPLLDVLNLQRSQFCSAQPAAQQNRESDIVALTSKTRAVRRQQKAPSSVRSGPITNRYPQSLGALYTANPSSQVCTEQTAIGGNSELQRAAS